MDRYVAKPISVHELFAILQSVVATSGTATATIPIEPVGYEVTYLVSVSDG